VVVIAPLLAAVSCAARAPFVPPVGPGAPAPHASSAWAGASAACRALSSYRAELGLTGQIGVERIRGLASARVNTAITSGGAVGLEAIVSGQWVFRLAGTTESAVLLLRDPVRVVTAPPDQILDALVGVALGPPRLLAIFGGCISRGETVESAAAHDGLTAIVVGDARLFLHQPAGAWRVRAGWFGDVAVEYFAFENDLPRDIVVRSTRPDGPAVRLELRIRQALVNTDVPSAAFQVNVPPDAVRLSVDELRETGPLVGDTAVR
jgi:hypothetical protein